MKKTILCLSETEDNVLNFVKNAQFLFFQMEPLDPEAHSFGFFEEIYQNLKKSTDLSKVDLVIAENIEAIPLVYFMRKDGFFCPAIFIPHTNAYPLNILFYFLLVSSYAHPADVVLCGSKQAAVGYEKFVTITALPTCTFGIKSAYVKRDKLEARKELGLPADKKICLYTGRFMNDKGLVQLLDVYEGIKKRIDNVVLVLSITHIDPIYFNMLAARMQDAILFYRLENSQMVSLNQSADLFISVATSIFETYGKSPLEAISCGVPAVVPNWDGFRYYINEANGSLVDVIYTDYVDSAPYSFAKADTSDFIEKCCHWLSKDTLEIESLPNWAYYEHTMSVLSEMLQNILATTERFIRKVPANQKIDFSHYPEIIEKICMHYEITTFSDLEIKTEALGLISRDNPGDLELLQELHDALFKVMSEENSCCSTPSCVR